MKLDVGTKLKWNDVEAKRKRKKNLLNRLWRVKERESRRERKSKFGDGV